MCIDFVPLFRVLRTATLEIDSHSRHTLRPFCRRTQVRFAQLSIRQRIVKKRETTALSTLQNFYNNDISLLPIPISLPATTRTQVRSLPNSEASLVLRSVAFHEQNAHASSNASQVVLSSHSTCRIFFLVCLPSPKMHACMRYTYIGVHTNGFRTTYHATCRGRTAVAVAARTTRGE